MLYNGSMSCLRGRGGIYDDKIIMQWLVIQSQREEGEDETLTIHMRVNPLIFVTKKKVKHSPQMQLPAQSCILAYIIAHA